MSRLCQVILLISTCYLSSWSASVYRVSDYDSFNQAQEKAQSGDSLVWKSGTYLDVVLDILKNGIIICPEDPGMVIFGGQTNLTIFADSVIFSGFQFKDGNTEGDILKVAGSHNQLSYLNFSNFSSHYYLNILPGAQHTQVFRCNFEKKPEDRTTSVFQIQAHPDLPGYCRVSYCSFKNFTAPADAGGDYGIEALRIGYSFQSSFIGRNIVEYCYFTKCNGDGEIISSKACENIYRYNTFADNGASHFTLRHGSANVVYGNFFLQGAGLRIKEGQNQMVCNNYFQTGEWFAINLMNHSADPLDNIIIANNSFAASGPILGGAKGEDPPRNVTIVNNLFLNSPAQIISDPTGTEYFQGNLTNVATTVLPAGFTKTTINYLQNVHGLYQLNEDLSVKQSANEAWKLLDIPELDDDPQMELDIMQQRRQSENKIVGCLLPGIDIDFQPYATVENTGPEYLIK